MIRRTLFALALCAFGLASAATAQPLFIDLLHHERTFLGKEVRQDAATLYLTLPPGGWASQTAFNAAQLDAALGWMTAHGYLFSDPAIDIDFHSDSTGNSITIDGPGIHVVIYLPCGPFIPVQKEQLMVVTIIRQIPPAINGY